MKRELNILALHIPAMNDLMAKNVVGGYCIGDDDYWQGWGSPDNPIELPEVVVTPSDNPDPGYDPNDFWDDRDFDDDYNDYYDDQDRNGHSDGDTDRGGYNVNAAVNFLREHAHQSSTGNCAKAVRMAIEAGGISTEGRPNSAKDYDSFLPKIGYHEVSKDNYNPLPGDIVVHEAQPGHPHGHIAMYDGQNWISDFVQRDMFGGSAYRQNPDYTLWRR